MPSLLTPASGTSVVGRCARMKLFRYCIHNCFGDSNERVIDGELNVICPSREPDKKIVIEFSKTCSSFFLFWWTEDRAIGNFGKHQIIYFTSFGGLQLCQWFWYFYSKVVPNVCCNWSLFIKRITKAGYHWAHKKLGVSLRLISLKNTADNSKLNYPPNFQGQLLKSVTIRQLFLRHGFLIKLLFVVWEREGGGGEWWGRRSGSGVSDGSGWAGVWFQVQLKLYIYHTPVKESIRVDQKVAEEAEADS